MRTAPVPLKEKIQCTLLSMSAYEVGIERPECARVFSGDRDQAHDDRSSQGSRDQRCQYCERVWFL